MGRFGAVRIVVLLMLTSCAPQAGAPAAVSPTSTLTAPASLEAAPTASAVPLATSEPTLAPTAAPTLAPTTAPTATRPPAAASQAGPRVIVEMKNYAFVAKDITIAAGTIVTWRNDDSAPHTATADDKSFDSGDMGAGDEFSYTFTKPGVYPYYCIWHGSARGQGMAGKVTVK